MSVQSQLDDGVSLTEDTGGTDTATRVNVVDDAAEFWPVKVGIDYPVIIVNHLKQIERYHAHI